MHIQVDNMQIEISNNNMNWEIIEKFFCNVEFEFFGSTLFSFNFKKEQISRFHDCISRIKNVSQKIDRQLKKKIMFDKKS